ncbi:MAG TPA: glycine zipper 2TM domain-containing protein [Sphingomonas sp.]|nr:glycine zipper 2TM domain-containing protein [Sphingomonas sp.]
MRRLITTALLAAMVPTALAIPTIPAAAQSPSDQQRWDAAQQRYRAETDRYLAERDRYTEARLMARSGYGRGYGDDRYGNNAPNDDRYDPNYDPSRYYRPGPNYQERTLAADDRVYRGSDGQYYCRRSDGTTGLIVGGAAGGVLGNVIDGGHSRTAGTLIGAAIGALAGKAVDQQNAQIRCR